MLDCNVGGIRCEGYRVLPQDECLLMMNPVLASDKQVTPLPPGLMVFNILVNIGGLVGKEVGVDPLCIRG